MIGIGISIPMMMPFAEDATAFVRSGVLRAPFTVSRSQVSGVQSSAVNGGNDGLTFYGADVPRFNGPAQRLLIEGQSTNGARNPGAEGAGPTNWAVANTGGLSFSFLGTSTLNNVPAAYYHVTGTAGAGAIFVIAPEGQQVVAASNGQTWNQGYFVALTSNVANTINTARINFRSRDNVPNLLDDINVTVSSPTATPGLRQAVATLAGGAGVAWIQPRFSLIHDAGVNDYILAIGSPHLALGAVPSSPILPPVGTPGASTRGADLINPSLASLGIPANGACTILWSGVVPNFITGATHTIACLDDGSVNNRFTMRVDQASGQLQAQRSLAGASTTANAGAVTAGAAIKGGMALNGSGRAAVSLNGGAVAAVTGGPSSGLTQFRLGNLFDGSAPMWGETLLLRILPSVSDSELQSLTGAMP